MGEILDRPVELYCYIRRQKVRRGIVLGNCGMMKMPRLFDYYLVSMFFMILLLLLLPYYTLQ